MCLEEREGRLCLFHRRREWNSQRITEEKVYDLELSAAACRVVQWGGDGPDFWAYVDDGWHLYYVSYWLSLKKRVIHARRMASASLQVLSPHYATIGDGLFCRGAQIADADLHSFQLVPGTRYAYDSGHVYAFTITEGLDRLPHAGGPLYFLPRCEHFADQQDFYWQSNWTSKIERVGADGAVDNYEKTSVLLANVWHDEETDDELEASIRAATLDAVRTVGDMFRVALPNVDALWTQPRPRLAG